MSNALDVSIIIPTFNRETSLRYTLTSLMRQTHPTTRFEVIVVDNESTDGTQQLVENLNTPYKLNYVRKVKERQFESAGTRNLGARLARGDVLIFLDDDMIVPDRFVENHMKFHTRGDNFAVLGKMLYLDDNQKLSDAIVGSDFKAHELGKAHFVGTNVRRFIDLSGNLPQFSRGYDFCIGANFSVRKATFERVGPLDENFDGPSPAGVDIAYGIKLHARGARLAYGRWALGFHQKNHPVFIKEDPEYFRKRMQSVRSREADVYEEYLQPEDLQGLVRKQRVNSVLDECQLKLTHQGVKQWLSQLRPIAEHGGALPEVTYLLINDDETRLESALTDLNRQKSQRQFEVIVLDPTAPVEHDAWESPSAADVIVQKVEVPYLLRYYPTGRQQFHADVTQLGQNGQSPNIARLRTRLYENHLRTLIDEKPFGNVSQTFLVSKCSLADDHTERLLRRLDEAMTDDN
jgi:glycosyltransferase involved in cell wall biosynthesis